MKTTLYWSIFLSVILVASGCTTTRGHWYNDWRNCALAGAAVGAAAGANEEDSEDTAVAAVGGAVIGGLLCGIFTGEEADSDGDGIPDTRDHCPGTFPGAAVNMSGCELDSDSDGVVNHMDRCPGTARGKEVDADGCPVLEVIVLEGVVFRHDSAALGGDSHAILNRVADKLGSRPDVMVEVAGHTDSQGENGYNQGLSQRRAIAVMKYLISRGVDANQLTARGYGETQPVADNTSAEGRAKNRRVELHIR